MKKDIISMDPNVASVEIEFDVQGNGVVAVYFRISDKPVEKTVEGDIPDTMIDLAKDGDVVGVEMINPSARPINLVLKKIGRKYAGSSIRQFQADNEARIKKIQDLVEV